MLEAIFLSDNFELKATIYDRKIFPEVTFEGYDTRESCNQRSEYYDYTKVNDEWQDCFTLKKHELVYKELDLRLINRHS
eukprot:Seg1196.6 transcript_id=Seg1196.6/GoldUCD/mRNA.D3Y31 product="hypothetical protein" protein_id=Seg1196.6/GoldUCD/D3Y31